MSLFMGLCRGPVTILGIKVGGETVFEGSVDGHGSGVSIVRSIDAPNVFGGDEKEGGIEGKFLFLPGGFTQDIDIVDTQITGSGATQTGAAITGPLSNLAPGCLPSIRQSITGPLPSFRGVSTVWFHGMVCALNPYPKTWEFQLYRTDLGWAGETPWYSDKVAISVTTEDGDVVGAMNPAHMIYQLTTDTSFGGGLPTTLVDDAEWRKTADTLYAEGLGLCGLWARQEQADEFIQFLLPYIGAVYYQSRRTGLLRLRLIRDDYDPDFVPLLAYETGLLGIDSDETADGESVVSEVVVSYKDPVTNGARSVRAQNSAARLTLGGTVSTSLDRPWFPTKDLAFAYAQKELRVASAGLKRYTVRADRRWWKTEPGDVVRLFDRKRGIGPVIVRVGDVAESGGTDGRITLKVVEDIFGAPKASYLTAAAGSFVPPVTDPVAAERRVSYELGYRDLLRQLSAADFAALAAGDCYVGTAAAAPNAAALSYDLVTRVSAGPVWTAWGTSAFCAYAVLADDITALQTEVSVSAYGDLPDPADAVGSAGMIGQEVVAITAYDPLTDTFTVARGCADTIPWPHVAGSTMWLIDDDVASDRQAYAEGESVETKLLTRTSRGLLLWDDAPVTTTPVVARRDRPYPMADMRVDGQSVYGPEVTSIEPHFTWVNRNKVVQDDQLVGHAAAGVVPPDGLEYVIAVFRDIDDAPLGVHVGLALEGEWTYTQALRDIDGASGRCRFVVSTQDDGVGSWQSYEFTVYLPGGWGDLWGARWGA